MKKILYISLTGILMMFVSCENFLKEEQHTNASLDYLNTAGGLETAINGVYQSMRWLSGTFSNTDNNSNSGQHNDYHQLVEYGADFVWEGSDGGGKEAFNRYQAQLNSGDGSISGFWTACYRGINRANTALLFLETVQGMTDTKEQREAELRFLRAYFYFDLVQHFGGVPIVTKGNTGEIITEFPRSSVAEVYQQIISDLKAAYAVLPDVWQQAQRGRATKWSTGHLLAKVYLTRGSHDLATRGGKTTDLDSAAYYAQAVINSGKFQLENNFAMVFDQDNQKESREIIWAVQYTSDPLFNGSGTSEGDGGNQSHLWWVNLYDTKPGMQRDIQNGRPWRRVRVNPEVFARLWDRKNDSRVYKTFDNIHISNNAATLGNLTWEPAYYINVSDNSPNENILLYNPPSNLQGSPRFKVGDTAIYYSSKFYGALPLKNYGPNGSQDRVLDDAKYRDMLFDIGKSPYTYIPVDKMNESDFPTMSKWMDNKRPSMNYQGGSRNFHRMRLAETYLIAAEALGRQGKHDEALEFINTVRKRAGWADGEIKNPETYKMYSGNNDTQSTTSQMEVTWADVINPTFPSGTEFDPFVDWMLEERSRELFGEFMRWEDLVRTGTLVARVRLYNPEGAPNIQDYHVLRPLPDVHIDRLSPKPPREYQNPGYY